MLAKVFVSADATLNGHRPSANIRLGSIAGAARGVRTNRPAANRGPGPTFDEQVSRVVVGPFTYD